MENKISEYTPKRWQARWWHLAVLCGLAFVLWGLNWYLVYNYQGASTGNAMVNSASSNNDEASWAKRGQFGDMFGSVNALFTALACAGVVFTILLQKQELADSAESQERLWNQQQAFQNEQREKQEAALREIESSRQSYLNTSEEQRRRRDQEAEKQFRGNMLRAIRREQEVLWGIFDKGTGALLSDVEEGGYHKSHYLMTQNFFSVYEANAINLGRLEADHARQIIFIYTMMKSFVEELRANNIYLDALDEAKALDTGAPGAGHIEAQNRIRVITQRLRDQFKRLQNRLVPLKEAVSKFYGTLDAIDIK